jgi:hypothetical protein
VRALLGSILLLVAGSASANMVTIEPDDFTLGTNLSNVTPGVHLSTLDGGDIFAAGVQIQTQYAQAPTGNLVFAQGTGYGLSNWYGIPASGFLGNIWSQNIVAWPDRVMVVRFDRPTDYFSFQGGGYSTGPFLAAYDENGDHMVNGSFTTNAFDFHQGPTNDGGGAEHFFSYELTSSATNIGFVIIGGNDNFARIDHIKYASVPEPSTAILFLTLLLPLVMQRTRNQRTSKKRFT